MDLNITEPELSNLLNSPVCCVLRNDLGLDNPPTAMGYLSRDWQQPIKCHQPDRLDDEEFNMFVLLSQEPVSGLVSRVNSIDFDFIPTEVVNN